MRYNLTVLRKLIIEAFDDEELTIFCHDHFSEVTEGFGAGMSRSAKALQLVTYCDRREQLGILVERIETERPEKYKTYKAQLESGEEAPSALGLEEIRAGASEYAEVLQPVSRAEPRRERVSMEGGTDQEADHPLAGSSQEVKRWFLDKLTPEEQAFVVTAALFSGLERQELMDLYRGALNILRPAEAQADREG